MGLMYARRQRALKAIEQNIARAHAKNHKRAKELYGDEKGDEAAVARLQGATPIPAAAKPKAKA